MGVVSRTTLKTYFERGDQPTEAQFVDLIDSLASKDDDKIIGSVDSISTLTTINTSNIPDAAQAIVLNFYSNTIGGGDVFYWDADGDKATHNGITTVDPTHSVAPGNAGWWASENTGTTGVWRRQFNGYITLLDAGAKGDSSTDDSNAVEGLIDILDNGQVLYIPDRENASYLLSSISSKSITKNIIITSDGKPRLKGGGSNDLFLYGDGVNISVSNIKFTDFGNVLTQDSGSTKRENIIIDNCEADSVASFLTDNGPSLIPNVGLIRITNTDVSNTSAEAIQARNIEIDEALIDNVSVDTAILAGIMIGSNESQQDDHDTGEYKVSNCVIKNVTNTGSGEAHGIFLFGEYVSVIGNHVENISHTNDDDTGAEGIYLKCRNSIISGNTLIDAGTEEGFLTLKGSDRSEDPSATGNPWGYANIVSDNQFIATQAPFLYRGGVNARFNSDAIFIGNKFEQTNLKIGGANQTVIGNQFYRSTPCVDIKYTGSNYIVSNNEMIEIGSNSIAGYGVFVEPQTSGLRNVTITGNAFRDEFGTNSRGVGIISTNEVKNLTIRGNTFDSIEYGIDNITGSSYTNIAIDDNIFESIGTDEIDATITANASLLSIRSNMGYNTFGSGEATITDASTSVSVTHGLANTPDIEDISVTPSGDIGSASKFWVNNITSSSFDINVDVAPSTGSNTATFAWQARIFEI